MTNICTCSSELETEFLVTSAVVTTWLSWMIKKGVFKTGVGASRWGVGWKGVGEAGEQGSGPQFHGDEHD